MYRCSLIAVIVMALAPPTEAQQMSGAMLPTQTASPLGTEMLTGTGAPTASTLANRATDGGVTFNLKEDFGAACDGSTDDTTAIQNWLDMAGPNVHLVAPAGTCLFSSALTLGAVGGYSVAGAGPDATRFVYTGSSTTIDLLTLSNAGAGSLSGVSLFDFELMSRTTMTGGFAIHMHNLYDDVIRSVWLDHVNSGEAGTGRLCGGLWVDGGSSNAAYDVRIFSKQNCGDGVRVNGTPTGAELVLYGGDVGGNLNGTTHTLYPGFLNGLHMAGGFGGFRCESTNIHDNTVGLLVDTTVSATGNREFDQGAGCAFDTDQTAGVILNDPYTPTGTMDFGGWIASTLAGPGILVTSWDGDINLRGSGLVSNCGDGIDVEDNTARVLISPALRIYNNGNLAESSSCPTWAAINSASVTAAGTGYGANVSGTMTWAGTGANQCTTPPVLAVTTNSAGAIATASFTATGGNAGVCAVIPSPTATTWTPGGGMSAGSGAEFTVASNAWHGFGVYAGVATGNITGPTYPFSNTMGSYNNLSGLSVTNITGAPQAQAVLNLNLVGGVQSTALNFESGGTVKWQFSHIYSGNVFDLYDRTPGAGVPWLAITAGGNATIGEGPTNTTTFNGAAAVGGNATVGGTLGVTGATTLGGGALTVSSSSGNSTITMNAPGGYGTGVVFQANGSNAWETQAIGSGGSSGHFQFEDIASSYAAALDIAPGGSATVGEQNSNVLTVVGSLAAKASATPAASGSCAATLLTGGQIAGSFRASTACASGTVTLTFAATQSDGYVCDAHDETTPADLLNQTAHTTTSVTFTGSMASGDSVVWKCIGF